MSAFKAVWFNQADGMRLAGRHYEGDPSKPLCVCLHGLTRNSKDFEDFAPHLQAKGYPVLALDMRGRGESDRDSRIERYSTEQYVTDCLGWLDLIGQHSAIWIGSSMGGGIATAINQVAPDRVKAVLLNDIGPEIDSRGLENIARIAGKGRRLQTWDDAAERCREVNGHVHPDETDTTFWLTFARRTHREIAPGEIKSDYDPAILSTLGSNVSVEDRWKAFEALRDKPVLLVRGAISELITPGLADKMQNRFPELERLEVAKTGHTPLLTEMDALGPILDWVSRAEYA